MMNKWTREVSKLLTDVNLESRPLKVEGQSLDSIYFNFFSQMSGYQIDNSAAISEIKELESQIKEMKSNITVESKNTINTQKKEFVYENIKKLADVWDSIDKKQKNMILKTIIDKIVIVNGNIEIQLKNF